MPGTSAIQQRNTELIDILSADFQRRYEPNFAWENAVAAHLMLPGLRGFWPMSAVDENGGAYDLSGQGRMLSYNGNPTYNLLGLAPYIEFDGITDYVERASEAGLNIAGTETYVTVARRGLTFGGWFYPNAAPALAKGLIGKWNDNGVAQRSYLLYIDPTPRFYCDISGTGGAPIASCVYGTTLTLPGWFHVVGRFTPSNELAIFVNGDKATLLAGIPASIFASTANFRVGSYQSATAREFNGRSMLNFLCAASLPDAVIQSLYHQTRALVGV